MIKEIRKKIKENKYEYSIHAVDQSTLRHITRREIIEAVESGKIIEDYPENKYGPGCLIYGNTSLGRPLHIRCSYPSRVKIKIITVYEPEQDEWDEYQKRRK